MLCSGLKNHTSTKALDGRTPYEAVNRRPPDLRDLPEWGCKVWVHDDKTGKVGVRAKEGHWVGYDENSKGHRIYWPGKQSVGVERNVKFSETHEMVPHEEDVVLKGEDEGLDETMTPASPPLNPPIPTPVMQPAAQPKTRPTCI